MANPEISCHLHNGETLMLYCCECVEIICLQCFLEKHQKHEMKRLSNIKDKVTEQLSPFVVSEWQKVGKTMENLKQFVEQEKLEMIGEEGRMKTKIEHLVKKKIQELEDSARSLLVDVEIIYLAYREKLHEIANQIKTFEFQDNNYGEIDTEFEKQMEVYVFMKQYNETIGELQNAKPKFLESSQIATIGLVLDKEQEEGIDTHFKLATNQVCEDYSSNETQVVIKDISFAGAQMACTETTDSETIPSDFYYMEGTSSEIVDCDVELIEQPKIIDISPLKKSLRKSISMTDLSATLLNKKLFKFPGCIADDSDC